MARLVAPVEDAAEEQGFAVQEDLRVAGAAGGDRAEAEVLAVVLERGDVENEGVQERRVRGPEVGRCRELDNGASAWLTCDGSELAAGYHRVVRVVDRERQVQPGWPGAASGVDGDAARVGVGVNGEAVGRDAVRARAAYRNAAPYTRMLKAEDVVEALGDVAVLDDHAAGWPRGVDLIDAHAEAGGTVAAPQCLGDVELEGDVVA